jgi:gliding motility-associated-like protein
MMIDSASVKNNNSVYVVRRYSIRDFCGNESSCTHTIRLTDTTPPSAVCNAITVYLGEDGKVVLSDIELSEISAGSSDNCTAPDDLKITVSTMEFDCTQTGNVQVVTVTVTDEAGNSDNCQAQITVKDNLAPEARCKDVTLYLDENGHADLSVFDVDNVSSDNCAILNMFLSMDEFDCSHVGKNQVTLTVVDTDSNTAECTATVTVIDTINPIVICKPYVTVQLEDLGGVAFYSLTPEEIFEGGFDACGIDSLFLSQYEFGCDDIGTNMIRLTAVDVNGNTGYCESEVVVYGNIAPVAVNDTVFIVQNTTAEINVAVNDYDTKTSIRAESVSTVFGPANGAAEVNKQTGMIKYTPDLNFVGTDVLRYSICDDAIPCEEMCAEAKVVIYVLPPNKPPVAGDDYYSIMCYMLSEDLLVNDFDPDFDVRNIETTPVLDARFGTLVINADGTFMYQPDRNFSGIDSFVYRICDEGLPSMCDEATAYIEVLPDTDCDGITDLDDIDDDNDGILDVVEGDRTTDTDGDGIYDSQDIDADNDGILDNIEGQGETSYIPPAGKDSNNNGWDDAYDSASGGSQFGPVDTDRDGTPDYLDLDADGDGVWDYIEGHDVNADGIPDIERFYADTDFDGLDDAYDTYDNREYPSSPYNETGSNAPLQDFDGDGTRDWRDANDDGDELQTIDEDWNNDGDYSNDDMDLDGHPDYLDIETDCELFVPEGFSPNGDGVHDFFQIFCIQRYPDAKLMIFNRAGNKLFEKEHYGNLEYWGSDQMAWWWGTAENNWIIGKGNLAAGNYVYILQLGNGETRSGTVMISY